MAILNGTRLGSRRSLDYRPSPGISPGLRKPQQTHTRASAMSPKSLKPRVFVGSSSESFAAATQLAKVLNESSNAMTWKDYPAFDPSSTTIESLLAAIDTADFAVFIIAPDDQTIS